VNSLLICLTFSEEIDEMFMMKLPARKFRKYVCTGQAAIESKNRNLQQTSSDGQEKGADGTVETIERVWGDERGIADIMETALNVA